MCGIAGFLDCKAATSRPKLAGLAEAMGSSLRHRGPDDGSFWIDENVGLALVHRRLSILDLSPLGRQPMHSSCGRYILTFNGEIYNHKALRSELSRSGSSFLGTSDTEVMLEAIRLWGLNRAVESFNGMFAFALWDRLDRRLFLARDRLGEKPLHYAWLGNSFVFASELKALRICPGFDSTLNPQALAAYLRFNYIPAPHTIYKGVSKVPVGSVLEMSPSAPREISRAHQYWSASSALERGQSALFAGSETEGIEELERLLSDAVGLRMEADVPLGAFLSGGIDSSAIVALMQRQSRLPVKTFTVGFSEGASEADHAARIAHHLGTEHHALQVTSQDALNVIPRLPDIFDEPFADSSQIPTFLIAEFARQHVTVSLSGDGGDELFGGYNRYVWANNLHQVVSRLPGSLRSAIAHTVNQAQPSSLERLATFAASVLPAAVRPQNSSALIRRMADFLAGSGPSTAYLSVSSRWTDAPEIINSGSFAFELPTVKGTNSLTRALMHLDSITYLPDDILVKVDRASMAVSLEARVPLLDHRVFEFACRLPVSLGWNGGRRKHYLRRVLARHIPEALFDRPKAGFNAPLGRWLRGPLRPWAEELLSESTIRAQGFLNPVPIRRKWSELLAEEGNWEHHLWSVIMLQAWLNRSTAHATPQPAKELPISELPEIHSSTAFQPGAHFRMSN